MDFLGVGWQEVIIIGVLMLVVVGPDRMPEMAYHIGRWVRRLQLYARAVRDEFREEFDYLETQYKTVQGELEEASTELKQQQADLNAEIEHSTSEIKGAAKSVESAVKAPVATKPASVSRNGSSGKATAAGTNGSAPVKTAAGSANGASPAKAGSESEPERPRVF